MKKLIVFVLTVITIGFCLWKGFSPSLFAQEVLKSEASKPASSILSQGDLPGYYFESCSSEILDLAPLGKCFATMNARLKELASKISVKEVEKISEHWYTEPGEILDNKDFDEKIKERLKKSGYFAITVERYILPSKSDALNFFEYRLENVSLPAFKHTSFSGRKIGDECATYRPDLLYTGYDSGMKYGKSLYFSKGNVVVHVDVNNGYSVNEVKTSFIEDLAELIASRL